MDNAATALLMAGGMILAVIVISIFVLSYTNVSQLAQTEVDATLQAEIDDFNKVFVAFNKTAMYGTDVISALNLAIDNNTRYNVSIGEEYYVDVSFKLLSSDSINNVKILHKFKDGMFTTKQISSTKDYDFEGGEVYSLSTDEHALRVFLQDADKPGETKTYVNQLDTSDPNFSSSDNSSYIIEYSGSADFKRKTFKCSEISYDTNGRVVSISFVQVKESKY